MKIEWDFKELTAFADKLTKTSTLDRQLRFATKELAAALLRHIKTFTPIGETYQLVNGWNGNDFAVKKVANGFEVLLVNTDEKALWVNDGHRAFNQYGGPYKIHDEVKVGPFGKLQGRIKVTTPYKWQKGNKQYYVFGHFFVERGILEMSNADKIEQIIMKKLQKWWEGCF